MIRKNLLIIFLLITVTASAQEGSKSPFSFFGIGELRSKGTNYERTMGSIGMLADSIHTNLLNPAALAKLKLTNYTLGLTYSSISFDSEETSANTDNSTVDYLTLAFPVTKKLSASFGFLPFSSVGFELQNTDSIAGRVSRFEGDGGVNRVFLAAGYALNDAWSLGVEANFNFGNIKTTSTIQFEDVQFGSRERNESDVNGFSFTLGVHHQKKLFKDKKLVMQSSATFSPEINLSSDNSRMLSTVIFSATGVGFDVDSLKVDVPDTDLVIPQQISVGTGIGEPKKWFAGVQFTHLQSSNFTNRFVNAGDVSFENSSRISLGGYYIPNYISFSSYLSRIQYMAGIRYEETGIVVNGESIDDFGISFGLGLPINANGNFSNATVGFEIGQKGTTSAGLVKENYFNFRVALSLNDRWFVRRKFN